MNKKHKIIFATIKVGFGHEIPALSVSNALKEMLKDNYEIILMDFMKDIGCSKIDLIHKKIWKYLLNHSLICKIGEKLLDVTWPASKLFIKLLLLPFYKCAFSFLVKNKSDIIFSTHPFNTMIIGDIKRIFKLKFKLINYLTELFDFSCLWIQKNIDYFLVPTIEAKNKAIKKGIPSSKIHIFDFPLRDSFFKIEDNVKYNVFKSLVLNPNKKTLLISLGGESIEDPTKYLDIILDNNLNINVIVITGKNKLLKNKLYKRYNKIKSKITLKILGYVKNIEKLIYCSDICFIKPGPNTTLEVMILKKPIIFTIPTHIGEKANIKFAVKHGVGFESRSNPFYFLKHLNYLIDDINYNKVISKYNKIHFRNGAKDIAYFIKQIIKS